LKYAKHMVWCHYAKTNHLEAIKHTESEYLSCYTETPFWASNENVTSLLVNAYPCTVYSYYLYIDVIY